jgi:hypothetical protein
VSRFRVLFVTSLILFSGIAMMAMLKKKHDTAIVFKEPKIEIVQPVEIAKVEPVQLVIEEFKPSLPAKKEFIREEVKVVPIQKMVTSEVDRVRRLFSKSGDKLPIVETVTYTSRVSWLKGRPAWIADYASHYNTSRHFIARSLNGKIDYITQKVAPGDKFNVFRQDKNFEFYLLVDLSACQMHFYYLDKDLDERVFLKSYPVGLGRKKEDSPSGSLTPIGKYSLGDKVAVYRSGVQGYYQNQKIEMINVFGTRWLPFGEELENCSDGAKGYGIHGVPCVEVPASGDLVEEHGGVGAYNSDGCIRLKKEDVEEIFSIVITKPTVVEIVKDMKGIKLPMNKEVNY